MFGALRIGSAVAAIGMMATVLVFGMDAAANPKKIDTMQIPKGATVQMQTKSTLRMNNSSGETGTFSCSCTGLNHAGTCILGRGSDSIICGTSGSTCEGTCKIFTTTGGFAGGGMMMMKRK